MTKTIRKLEKENAFLRKKFERAELSMAPLSDEVIRTKAQLEMVTQQKKKLEDLCRALQLQRGVAPAESSPAPAPSATADSALKAPQQLEPTK